MQPFFYFFGGELSVFRTSRFIPAFGVVDIPLEDDGRRFGFEHIFLKHLDFINGFRAGFAEIKDFIGLPSPPGVKLFFQ